MKKYLLLTHNQKRDPSISIIIPVLKEAFFINNTVAHLVDPNPFNCFEVIVSDGHPQGTPLAAVCDPRIRKILSPLGQGAQMNTVASPAKGKILIFIYADILSLFFAGVF